MFSNEKSQAYILENGGDTFKLYIVEVTNGADAMYGAGALKRADFIQINDIAPMMLLDFLETKNIRKVSDADKESSLSLFQRSGGKIEELVILKIPKDFMSTRIVVDNIKTHKEAKMDEMTEEEYEKGLAEAIAADPDFKYKILTRILFEDGQYLDFDIFDPDDWDEDLAAYSDDMAEWSFSIEHDSDLDNGFCVCISPTSIWMSDYSLILNEFVRNHINPKMPGEFWELCEATYEIQGEFTEAEVRKALLDIGLSEIPSIT